MKQYGVNVEYQNGQKLDTTGCDTFDFYGTFDTALANAMAQFEADETIDEIMVAEFDDDEIEDFPLYLRREDGNINQYRNGERLWA